jgi:hypothetical protein
MHETVIDDPVLRLIEWHSGAVPSWPSDATPSLDDKQDVEAGPCGADLMLSPSYSRSADAGATHGGAYRGRHSR